MRAKHWWRRDEIQGGFHLNRILLFAISALLLIPAVYAQDLSPRAYIITPVHANAVTLSYSYSSGALNFNGAVPITGATGKFSAPSIALYHAFCFFGRSANVLAALPYGVGNFEGEVLNQRRQVYRSGLFDSVFRLSVNLKGGPAMEMPKFVKWKQKTLIGVTLKVIPPTGQYYDTRLVNWGANRWSIKPEVGISRRFHNKWIFDAYSGVWFFTANSKFYTGGTALVTQTQAPMGSFEGHVSRDFRPFLWVSLDGNFWVGGATTTGGVTNSDTRQTASRVGITGSFPLNKKKNQAIKVSFSNGAYVRFGGDYTNFSVAWQYSWIGRPN
jgi:hypothetical protein